MQLTTQEKRQGRDLITENKLINQPEETDKKYLILKSDDTAEILKGCSWKLRKERCLNNTEKYSFHQRSIDICNGLSVSATEI